ncbi:MAG: hypothetical protein ACREEV_11890, partial [Dongiaceae bacterium]
MNTLIYANGGRLKRVVADALMPHRRSAMKTRMSGDHSSFDPIPLHAWLIEAGLSGLPTADLLGGFCSRLVAGGVPLSRGFLSLATLHPQRRASSLTWEKGDIAAADFGYAYMPTPGWQGSPFHRMLETGTRRRHRRLAGDGAVLDFPVLSE